MKDPRPPVRRKPLRPTIETCSLESIPEKPKKKALLIGINYGDKGDRKPENGQSGQSGKLNGPHKDVEKMQRLLMSTYEYQKKDIVTLVDKEGTPEDSIPSRTNILREIKRLIQGARAGDRFFFHYSGHSTQKENKSFSEEDGMDECLVTCKEEIIPDNELRRNLVDALPVGCSLVAIFDTCHSQSLLDLEHYWCNRVWVPWVSKGRRRSDSLRNRQVRRDAIPLKRPHSNPPTRPTSPVSRANCFKVYSTRRISANMVVSRQTSIDQIINTSTRERGFTIKSSKQSSLNTQFVSLEAGDGEGGRSDSILDAPMMDSPVALFPCDGFCREREVDDAKSVPRADIISLASCEDSQVTWEDGKGRSMTTVLIKLLKRNPHPSLQDLLLDVSHHLHDRSLNIHKQSKRYKKQLKAHVAKTGKQPLTKAASETLETDNFQDPQFASHMPLDMTRKWDP